MATLNISIKEKTKETIKQLAYKKKTTLKNLVLGALGIKDA